jgi:hypothetical protein
MLKAPRRSPVEAPLLFDVDPEPAEDLLTGLAGLTLVAEAFRGLSLGRSANQHLQIKERQRGFDEGTYVESFVLLNAAGGDCLDDFDRLREDRALAELLGHPLPSPEAARKFLYAFHDEEKIEQAKQQREADQVSYIPAESEPLRGLAQVTWIWCANWGGAARSKRSPPSTWMAPSSTAPSRRR